jgi:hypothetical protein
LIKNWQMHVKPCVVNVTAITQQCVTAEAKSQFHTTGKKQSSFSITKIQNKKNIRREKKKISKFSRGLD